MTDPTPRTAATTRERDIYETVREVIRDYTCLPFGLGEAMEMCSLITSAIAAAEAPGRVAALERLAETWEVEAEALDNSKGDVFALAARQLRKALATPAPTPSEPVARCENCGHEAHDSALGCTFESTADPDWFCACQHGPR